MSWVSLIPHQNMKRESGGPVKVMAQASFLPGVLELVFLIEPGNFELPDLESKRVQGLWNDTCFEAFLKISNSDAYLEFNGSLAGNWNLFWFDSYRAGMKPMEVKPGAEPRLVSRIQSLDELRVVFSVPLSNLGENSLERIGLTVVLNTNNQVAYFAIQHDGEKPDFHLESSFTYDPIRN